MRPYSVNHDVKSEIAVIGDEVLMPFYTFQTHFPRFSFVATPFCQAFPIHMLDVLSSFLVVRGVASAVCSIAGWLSVRSPMPKVSGIYACLCLREGKSFLTCCTTAPGKG